MKANGDNAVVVVNQVTPICVTFGVPGAVPGRHSPQQRRAQAGRAESRRKDNPGHMVRGRLERDRQHRRYHHRHHPSEGGLRATPNRVLWPGQFVNVVLTLDTQTNATVVPSEAVQAGQKGQMIYVVKADKTVEPRIVTVGPARSGSVVVEKGVAAGETVVTDGQMRLFPGARIQAGAGQQESIRRRSI